VDARDDERFVFVVVLYVQAVSLQPQRMLEQRQLVWVSVDYEVHRSISLLTTGDLSGMKLTGRHDKPLGSFSNTTSCPFASRSGNRSRLYASITCFFQGIRCNFLARF
jgi:hypothetical protein